MADARQAPGWRYVDAAIVRVEGRIGRQLQADLSDGALVTSEEMGMQAEGEEEGLLALRIASAEGNRRRIYWRNHQATGMARWFTRQGSVFKATGQFPLTVRAPRQQADGTVAQVEVAAAEMTGDELDAWIANRHAHLAGEAVNLDVFVELRRLWLANYPDAETLGQMCALAGLDLLDLRFTA